MFRETGKAVRGTEARGKEDDSRGKEKKNWEDRQVVFRAMRKLPREREISVTRGPSDERDDATDIPLKKNPDNTSTGGGAHLNVCIHTLLYRFDERCGQNYSN